jgi:hypothetical protein
MEQRGAHRDPPAHREAEQVAFRHAEMVEHAQHVGDVVVEGERAVVVVAAP